MKKFIDAIKVLSAEAVESANSGHPGLPLGAATTAFTLWDRMMSHNPDDPNWINRDRFILSAGHGSALLYSLLHLYGYGLELKELKNFRQLNSETPGHPEYGHTIGVETTTGPLGQGFANGVGMAMAEKHLGAIFNKPGFNIINHYTYVIAGDGCMMEGITNEAASLAGTLNLSKLIVLYDSNDITIEGKTDLAFKENVGMRFKALKWDVSYVEDGNDIPSLETAIEHAKETDLPSLIVVRTVIGDGAPGKEGTHGVHGAPLGEETLAAMKRQMDWPEASFHIPNDVKDYYDTSKKRLIANAHLWDKMYLDYAKHYPELAVKLKTYYNTQPNLFDISEIENKTIATRSASGEAIQLLAKNNMNFIGGSADLAPSNKTYMNDVADFFAESPEGRNIHFGVREHAMGAVMNGMALHGGLRVYGGTFLVFSDYMKPAIRLAALMKANVTYVFTHDSIGVGEDGPTHQPIEHLWMLRSIPNMTVIRPADYFETMVAWQSAMTIHGPVALILTRQNLPALKSKKEAAKGGYTIYESEDAIGQIIATGSEVHVAIEAAKALKEAGKPVRVISMPSLEIFNSQSDDYRRSVIKDLYTVAIEAGSTLGWYRYADDVIGIDTFGASGPAKSLFEAFNITVDHIKSYF